MQKKVPAEVQVAASLAMWQVNHDEVLESKRNEADSLEREVLTKYDECIKHLQSELKFIEQMNAKSIKVVKGGDLWQPLLHEQIEVGRLESKLPKKFFTNEAISRASDKQIADKAGEIEQEIVTKRQHCHDLLVRIAEICHKNLSDELEVR